MQRYILAYTQQRPREFTCTNHQTVGRHHTKTKTEETPTKVAPHTYQHSFRQTNNNQHRQSKIQIKTGSLYDKKYYQGS